MDSTAVLIFASLEHSTRKFPDLKSKTGRLVFGRLTRRVIDLSRQAFGEDVFLSVPEDELREFENAPARLLSQTGSDFGERLCKGVEQVFRLGYERVLVLGNDTPQLEVEVLNRCQEEFKTASVLLGPDHRGGIYLLGVSSGSFDLLSRICWNRNSDFAQLVAECELHNQSIAVLSTKSDLDNQADLERILRNTPGKVAENVRSLLRRLLTRKPISHIPTARFDLVPDTMRSVRIKIQLPPPPFLSSPA